MPKNPWMHKLCAACLWTGALASGGTLYQYEGFAYPSGSSLFLQNGGSGWSGAWGTPGGLDATIGAASLTSGALAVSGGSLSTPGSQPPNQGSSVATWVRNLGTQQDADNTTVYLSFLLRPDAGFGYYGGVNIGSVFAGLSGNQSFYGLEGPVNDLSLSSVPVAAGQTVLFVLRADFHPGNDSLSLYLNPTPGLAEPVVADATKTNLDVGLIDSLTINNYGGFTIDELRIGSTFESVTPTGIPEPSYAAGVAVAAALLAWAHRNRQSRA